MSAAVKVRTDRCKTQGFVQFGLVLVFFQHDFFSV